MGQLNFIFPPKSKKNPCSGDKTLTVKFHSCWASNTQPSTTDLHDLGKHAVGALFMFGANGMEERWPRNRETSASFPILVLFDKQAVEHSVFKRTRTRNSFDYSQSCHLESQDLCDDSIPMDSALIQHSFPALEAATQTMNTSVQINCDSLSCGRH